MIVGLAGRVGRRFCGEWSVEGTKNWFGGGGPSWMWLCASKGRSRGATMLRETISVILGGVFLILFGLDLVI